MALVPARHAVDGGVVDVLLTGGHSTEDGSAELWISVNERVGQIDHREKLRRLSPCLFTLPTSSLHYALHWTLHSKTRKYSSVNEKCSSRYKTHSPVGDIALVGLDMERRGLSGQQKLVILPLRPLLPRHTLIHDGWCSANVTHFKGSSRAR